MSPDLAPLAPSPVALATQARSAGLRPPAGGDLRSAAEAFESLLLGQMMTTMRSTIPHSGLFGESETTRSTYDYLMDQALIEKAVKGGKGFGLAAQLEKSWQKAREGSPSKPGSGKPDPLPID